MMTASSEKESQAQEQAAASEDGALSVNSSGEFPPAPELMVTTLRAGSVLIVLFQTAYLFLDLNLPVGVSIATLPLHLTNIATGIIGFFMVLTPMGRRHWRALTLWAVTVVLFSTTALSVISGRNEPFYLSVLLMVTGAAALLPWEARWQLSLNGVALAMMVIQSVRVPDEGFEIHWLTGLIALGLAQTSVIINEHYRRAIEKARMAALEASEAKSGFLSSMSHEIRTPMNAIVGLAEVLGETPLTNEQRRYVNTMFANGKSLLELINNILDLAKIES
ncbi:MAG TPA: histidine kinase dimerization/phospho-acceptor domain-containing protein, partial [Candidatus Binataceae bacterium]|nr:histidine kinase dimerization/phospho-acceptor domain-containing protein [Candidatus Binataceae bacterium]